MGSITEIIVWTRGVVMDKEGRDVMNGIAQAAILDGKFADAFDDYEDLPDRVLVPVRKYARVSDEEIEHKYIYYPEVVDISIVVEPALVKGMNVLKGLREGGLLLVNTKYPIEYIMKFIPNADVLGGIATVDAEAITGGKRVVDFSGTEGGVDAVGIGVGLSAPILGALARVSGIVKKESLARVVQNVSAMERGYNEVNFQKLNKTHHALSWSI